MIWLCQYVPQRWNNYFLHFLNKYIYFKIVHVRNRLWYCISKSLVAMVTNSHFRLKYISLFWYCMSRNIVIGRLSSGCGNWKYFLHKTIKTFSLNHTLARIVLLHCCTFQNYIYLKCNSLHFPLDVCTQTRKFSRKAE